MPERLTLAEAMRRAVQERERTEAALRSGAAEQDRSERAMRERQRPIVDRLIRESERTLRQMLPRDSDESIRARMRRDFLNCGCDECREALRDMDRAEGRLTSTADIDPKPYRERSPEPDPDELAYRESRQRERRKQRAIRVRLIGRVAFRRLRQPAQREYREARCPSCRATFFHFQRAHGRAVCQNCGRDLIFNRGVIQP